MPSKAPFSKRFEEAVEEACESASARQVTRRFEPAASTVRASDLRYLERWAVARRKPALPQMGVDEVYPGKKQTFITVVSNLESREPLWFGAERRKRFGIIGVGGKHLLVNAFCRDVLLLALIDLRLLEQVRCPLLLRQAGRGYDC